MLLQNLAAKRLYFTLEPHIETGALKPQVEPANPREK